MKFNTNTKQATTIVNHEGATAYRLSHNMKLYTAVVTASLNDTFYEKEGDRLQRISLLVAKANPVFVAKLAVYAREQMHLRSIPLVLVAELAKVHQGDNLVGRTATRVIQRADEITELLAYYQLTNARSGDKALKRLSKQLQKGIGAAFNKFDEYQFAKYNRKAGVTLKDALFITHPRAANEAQQALFNKIAANQLEKPYTWEVRLSELGKQPYATSLDKAIAKATAWKELITSGKLGYMALLRNLRNILEAGVGAKTISIVAKQLTDPHAVRNSRQLPFRFLAAYHELERVQAPFVTELKRAVECALAISTENISGFDKNSRVLIASDTSGSMYQPISAKSKIRCYDIGLVLSVLLAKKYTHVTTGIFGDTWLQVNLHKTGLMNSINTLNRYSGKVGYSTNGHTVVEALIKRRKLVDQVMFFTDMQLWDSGYNGKTLQNTWAQYRQIAPKAKLYLFDLAGYGQAPLKVQNGVHMIAGWNDRVFDVLAAINRGQSALKAIERIEL